MGKKIKVEDRMTEEQKLISNISDFASKNKKYFTIGAIALAAVLLIVLIATAVSNSSSEKALVKVATCEDMLNESDVNYDEIIADLEKEVKSSSYASVKAQYLIGIANAKKDNFANAYDAFVKASKMNSKLYIAKLALMNAAVCKDNLGNTDEALDLYNQVVGMDSELGLGARALFNIARIYYEKGNKDLAKATFESLIADYPLSEYSNAAKNIVSLM